MSRKLVASIVALVCVACGFVALGAYYFYNNYSHRASATVSSPLQTTNFSSEPMPYPSGWLDDLRLPEAFTLVDSASGTFPESMVQGWAAKFRFKGNPSDAVKLLSPFLEEKGWKISESHELEAGGFVLLIQKENGNGIFTIDRDQNDKSQTLIAATIFP
jgi:hypothetical protein